LEWSARCARRRTSEAGVAKAAQATHRGCGRSRVPRFASAPRIFRLAQALLLTLLLVPCVAARLIDVRSARHSDFTRIVFETDEKVSYAIENRSLGSERIIELTLPATAREMILRVVHEPAFSVQIDAAESGSRALVRVTGPVDVWTNQLGNPPRVVLDLRVAESVADRDPEQLDALDYQIVVEANPEAPRPDETLVAAADPPAVEAAAADPPREQPTGWARSSRLWWMLVAIAVAFLGVLWIQRLTLKRRQPDRIAPPGQSPSRPDAVETAEPPAPEAQPIVPEPSQPAIEPAAPPTPPPVATEPPARRPEQAPESDASRDLFVLLSRMEERLAVLEREVRETRTEGRELRERSMAHAEELRAHRVAVSRILRRPRARVSGAAASAGTGSPSSS
jgi:hypothetical protein